MEQTRTDCEKLNELIRDFFEFETPNQLNEKLSLLLGNYVVNAPVQKPDLADMAYVVSRLTAFMFTLKELNTQTDLPKVLIDGDVKECLHN